MQPLQISSPVMGVDCEPAGFRAPQHSQQQWAMDDSAIPSGSWAGLDHGSRGTTMSGFSIAAGSNRGRQGLAKSSQQRELAVVAKTIKALIKDVQVEIT